MQHVLSTFMFASQRLTPVLLDGIHQSGVAFVEIHPAQQHIDFRNRAQMNELSLWFRDSRMKVHALHAPNYFDGQRTEMNIAEPVKAKRVVIVDEIKRALETAERLPFRYLIQHLGASGEAFGERAVDAAFTSLEELKLFAKHLDVEILLENIPNELSTCEALLTFLDRTHLDLNFCLDLGHAHMHEGVANAYRLWKPQIRSVHAHDNNGEEDSHSLPFTDGTIDWTEAMELLRSSDVQYPLVLEARESPEKPDILDEVQRVFDQLEELKSRHES